MPTKPIDLDALERVLGPPPRRYPKGNPHNWRRHEWYNRASAAIGALVQRHDRKFPAVKGKVIKQSYLEAMRERAQHAGAGALLYPLIHNDV